MNILFVTIAWPENGRNLYTDLMSEFKNNGHEVTVLCNREKRVDKSDSFKNEDGINVLRINAGNIKKAGTLEKGLSLLLLNWRFKIAVYKYLSDNTFDLILFNTPPITLSGFLGYIKDQYRCPVYVLLKDMWPYGFADFGVIKKGGWIYNYLQNHERKVFELADIIGCMSPRGVDFVLDNYPHLDKHKVEVCPNSMRVNDGVQHSKNDGIAIKVREKYGIPEDATVFIFSGNLGLGHGLDFLVDSIIKLKDYHKAFFLVGGAGTHFDSIKKRIDAENLPNAFIYSYLPEEEFKELMSICDVGLILLDSKYTYPQFPSRLLGYLQAKMAVLCAVNRETDIGEIVARNRAGMNILHGDVEGFMESIRELSENSKQVKKMGENGYNLLKKEYDIAKSYEIIMSHFVQELEPTV